VNTFKACMATLLLVAWTQNPVHASEIPVEIDFLLTVIGESGCTFIRNGKEHNATDAEKHLRTKYRRAKRYAPTTEKFIENLASRSSMSKKPYMIECEGQHAVETGAWLEARLENFRAAGR
jgi:hypothetical protein